MSQWVRARHAETGNEGILPVSGLASLPYWAQVGEPAETQQELQQQMDQERLDAEELEADHVRNAAAAAQDGLVDDVLAVVGDCAPAAAAALEVEQGKDQPRTTLVSELEQIVDRPDSATSEGT